MAVEVGTRALQEVKEVLLHIDRGRFVVTHIMLDNMTIPLPNGDVDESMLKEVVQLIKIETEASCNVTRDTSGNVEATRVTCIFSGGLTHFIKPSDIDTEVAFLYINTLLHGFEPEIPFFFMNPH